MSFEFVVRLNISFIWGWLGFEEKALEWEASALALLPSTPNAMMATSHAINLYRLCDFYKIGDHIDKYRPYAMLIVDLVKRFEEEIHGYFMLTIGKVAPLVQESGEADTASWLIELTMKKVRSMEGEHVKKRQLAYEYFRMGRYSEAYELLEPLIGVEELATGLAARCLFFSGKTQ